MTYQDKYFKEDKNHILRAAQGFVETQLLNQWVKNAINGYMVKENPLGLVDTFISQLNETQTYSLDFLTEFYELLSAIYRLKKGNNQLEIIWDGRSHYEVYAEQWSNEFENWTHHLCMHPEVYRAIIKVCVLKLEGNHKFLFYGIRRKILQEYQVTIGRNKLIKSA